MEEKEVGNFCVFWDELENIPIIGDIRNSSNLAFLASDLRPVFIEEKYLLTLISSKVNDSIYFKSVWATKQGRYYVNGKPVISSIVNDSKKIVDLNIIIELVSSFKPSLEMLDYERKLFEKFINANQSRINYLLFNNEKDDNDFYLGAEPFINQISQSYSNRYMLVSFSGGKDSTVVSHLVRKTLNNQNVLHIFGDTTLELPKTMEYIERFKKENHDTPFLEEKNYENDFFEISKLIGPPSRVKSWCCSIFKTGPMGTTLSNFDKSIITFYGIRRSESSSRSKYDKVTQSPKIKKQIVASPIIDWLDIDIWLYILKENLDFNDSYRQGFSRVGCWCCPNNSFWSDFLSSVYNPEQYKNWYNFLIQFSKDIGKEDYKDYVMNGKWKARQGGAGIEKSTTIKINSKECTAENNSRSYQLTRLIDDEFFELFKPFGKLNFDLGKKIISEVLILSKKNEILFKMVAKKNTKQVRVTNISVDDQYFFNKIENQLRKFNACIYCGACNSACPIGAIVVNNKSYQIDEIKCIGIDCLKCVNHFKMGCLIANALAIKKEEF